MSDRRIFCSDCGAEGTAGCDCVGAGRISAFARAAKAVAESPEKSNRAIADEYGVALGTVNKARKSGEQNCSPPWTHGFPVQ